MAVRLGSAGEDGVAGTLDGELGRRGGRLLGAADDGSVAADAIAAVGSALAGAARTAGGEGWNRCCGSEDSRGFECPEGPYATEEPRDCF